MSVYQIPRHILSFPYPRGRREAWAALDAEGGVVALRYADDCTIGGGFEAFKASTIAELEPLGKVVHGMVEGCEFFPELPEDR
jgi:hypothetical protein